MGNRESIKDNGIKFEIRASTVLYYANAVNNKGFIEQLEITSDTVLNDVALDVQFVAASGRISLPFSLSFATVGSVPVVEKDLLVQFDPNLVYQISDAQSGTIEASLSNGETTIAKASWPVHILPSNYWAFGDTTEDYGALAAFVQPNHPSIREILDETVAELKSSGKNSGLSGYQQPLSHVDEMVESLYNALKKRKITYSNPPASWAGVAGQKIRNPQEILSEGVGTCLDTAVLFASALEQMGLEPIVVLVPGHAFVGYWSAHSKEYDGNPTYGFGALNTIESAANLIDHGLIKLFETTAVCEGSDATFADAVDESRRRLEAAGAFGASSYESWLLNVTALRFPDSGIYPMPAKFVESNGNVTVVEYKPEEVDLALLRDTFKNSEGRAGNTVSIDVPPVVKRWLDSLLDLSLRNPLINMRDRVTNMRLMAPDGTLGVIEDALQADKSFQLAPGFLKKSKNGEVAADLSNDRGEASLDQNLQNMLATSFAQQVLHTNTSAESFITRMRRINSEAKSFQEETGSNGLYLALGTLTWKSSTAELQSPLILIPVSITAKNRNRDFYISLEESGVTPNFSLVEKLKLERNLNLPGLANLQTDNYGVDVEGTFEYVREELNKAGLNDFRVDMTATLGLFNFSSFRLWKDMLDNWQKFERNPLVKHLIHTPTDAFVDPCEAEPNTDLDSLIAQLPIPADGSQAQAVSRAISGKTFILQGPPGTGKSQTITNLLAKSLDEGKRVLFVAEKKDALDVVKTRMDQSGIGAFSLDLHDKASTSKVVREQLGGVIDILIDADKSGFDAALQDYELALGPLRNYRAQLHEMGPLGESVYSAKQKYLSISSGDELEIPGEFISNATPDQHHTLLESAKSITELGVSAGTSATNPWSFAGVDATADNQVQTRVKELVSTISDTFESVKSNKDFVEFLRNCSTEADIELLLAFGGETMPVSAVEFCATRAGGEQLDYAITAIENLNDARGKVGYALDNLKSVNVEEMGKMFVVANESWFLPKFFKLRKIYKDICRILGPEVPFEKSELGDQLETLASIEKQALKVKSELDKLTGMRFEDDLNVYVDSQREGAFETVLQLRRLTKLASFSIGDHTAQVLVSDSTPELREKASTFAQSVLELWSLLKASEPSTVLWCGAANFGNRVIDSIPLWRRDSLEFGLTPLIRWVALLEAAAPFYKLGLSKAVASLLSGQVPYSSAANAFEKGFYRSLFENLLVVKGLNSFDGTSINNFIRKLDDSHSRLRERLPKVLGAELLSRRGFDSSMKIGAIGDLMLAIKQSRNSMPLRTLLSRHWDIITRITPCVLASPDSAVRFIDPSFEAFDIVVFDEASQIRVANAIGALGRAKSAIVVGDSMQMPPTSVAQTKVGANDEDDNELDSFLADPESILTQCEIARVPDIMLKWHYRSEDESLIAFSNKAYYDGKLSTFPTPNLDPSMRSLQFVQVKNGQFIRSADEDGGAKQEGPLRTNPAEAKAIVEDVIARLENPATANDSIGIVTFNLQQKNYVQGLLDASENKALIKALEEGVGGEPIFVKNLEAVQGRERDVILFSIAFSAKKSDPKNLPLNFGPITHQGGEKRLNVAITRARKEVKIFCSFKPSTLVDKAPPSAGLQDLANYLVMASSAADTSIATLATRELKHDQHRSNVFNALKESGLPVVEEIGLSDFKVDVALLSGAKDSRAVMGILLDGPRWESRLTVSDRDCLPVELLKNRMGWPAIERIWLPDWIRDQQGEIARIKAAYQAALKAPKPKATPKPVIAEPIFVQKASVDAAEISSTPVDALLEATPTWMQLQSSIIATQEYLDYLHDRRIKDAVLALIGELINTEGPVSKARIGKFVANCFGYSRVVPARVDAIYSVVGSNFERDAEGFIYPSGKSILSYTQWQKSAPGSGRVAEEISLTEIANAMKDICRVAGGVRYEQLVKETSRVFGIQKMSTKITERFDDAYNLGLKSKKLEVNGDYVLARG